MLYGECALGKVNGKTKSRTRTKALREPFGEAPRKPVRGSVCVQCSSRKGKIWGWDYHRRTVLFHYCHVTNHSETEWLKESGVVVPGDWGWGNGKVLFSVYQVSVVQGEYMLELCRAHRAHSSQCCAVHLKNFSCKTLM